MTPTESRLSRRDFFVASSSSVIAAFSVDWRRHAPRVTAAATPFYAHPDAGTTLVRFVATGVNAPAGRLRVYDARRRLLGTAGMLNTGRELLGELWLTVTRTTTVLSELEAPGVRGIHRTTHRVSPAPRWTVYWLPVIDPGAIDRHFRDVDPLARSVGAGLLREAGVVVNPRASMAAEWRDHVRFLQQTRDAGRIQETLGLPVSPVAWSATGVPSGHVLTALTGSGVTVIAHPGAEAAARVIDDGAGAQLLSVAVPSEAWGMGPGIDRDVGTMEEQLGEWLGELSAGGGPAERAVMLVSDDLASVVRSRSNVNEWNRRYLFPRIVVGSPEPRHFPSAPITEAPAAARIEIADREGRAALAQLDAVRRRDHGRALFATLASLLPGRGEPHAVVAAAIASDLPGTVVFNPSPYLRTDYVELPDGRIRVATDIPPIGYAYLVDVPDATAPPEPRVVAPPFAVDTDRLRVALVQRTGAIGSVVDADGIQWASGPLNHVPEATASRVRRQELPGVGIRLTIDRTAPRHGPFTTTVTIYDTRSWIDIENRFEPAGTAAPEVHFAFAEANARASWEVPGGVEHGEPPIAAARHLRWIHLQGSQNVFFRALGAPLFAVTEDGSLISYPPTGRARYRIACDSLPATASDASRVGWSAEPLIPVHVNGGGGPLPRWGSLVTLDQPGAAIVGVSDLDANGVTVFVQELSGVSRSVSLGGDVVEFSSAEVVDFTGRVLEGRATGLANGVTFPIRRHGFAAVRLTGLTLRQG